jgi:hypothetical protein
MKLNFAHVAALVLALHVSVPAAPPVLDWQSRGVGGGGALFAPSFSPHDANELWISCDMSELFRSKTLGASWAMVPFRQLQGNRESWVRFTSDPNIVFSLNYAGDVGRPAKSTDGGKTWNVLATYPDEAEGYGIWADPTSTQRVILSGYGEIHFSGNGGTSWNTVYTTANGSGARIAGVFWDGQDIVIGTNLGLVTSSNGGGNFALTTTTGLPAGRGIVSFAGARTGNVRRLQCVTSPGIYNGMTAEEVYDEVNAAAPSVYTLEWGSTTTWQLRTTGLNAAHWIAWAGMARTDVSVMWVAGVDNAENPVVYRSMDAGANWSSVLTTLNNGNVATGWAGHGGDRGWSYGTAPMGFSVAPTDPAKAAFTDYGFCHLTTNGGTNWRQAYTDPRDQNPAGTATPKGKSYRSVGLEDTTCWQVFFPTSSRVLLANSDIRGSKSDDGGFSWGFNYSGHTDNSMYRVVKHSSGSLYAATSNVHDMYQSTYLTDSRIDGGLGKVIWSTDNGQTWTTLWNPGRVVMWVAVDPTNPNRMYASLAHSTQGGIWRTDNLNAGTPTWTRCTVPVRTEGHGYNVIVLNDGALVASYSARRTSGGAFTASSGVFYSMDQGNTWADRSHTDMRYWTKDVVIDPHDATQNTWYAGVFKDWGTNNDRGGLYRTTNRGQNWTQIYANGNAPSGLANVESITVHPTTPGTAYMTTEQDGLLFTSNLGPTPTWEAVTSYPFRQPTRVFFDPSNSGKIWVTSFGHGLKVGMAPLASWKEQKFGPQSADANIAGDLADPDHDGVCNLVEFAKHMEPLVPDARTLVAGGSSGLPVLLRDGGWRFDYVRRTAASGPGITYVAESSTNIVDWVPVTGTLVVTGIDERWERVSWPVNPSEEKRVYRVRVTRP